MEKQRQDLYNQIIRAYDCPDIRENTSIAQTLLTASNKLIKNQNPIVIASELNNQVDTYFIEDKKDIPKSLYALKDALKVYIEV
ncbi:enterocin immunity protein [Streptococcus bovimastitidis]|uniref:Enterocin immunity protein n=1 Tax=Streptococcus bovimastitidis TaxID=1856638 RepID=A0A1L8MLB9_9STRE|nr:bacteriocin immunity protein [Streptococcus bovimastitidis]OJF71521.1 enterocin immunity protein [Streptococcus bovimastitidis]